jgi:hypothetical protein
MPVSCSRPCRKPNPSMWAKHFRRGITWSDNDALSRNLGAAERTLLGVPPDLLIACRAGARGPCPFSIREQNRDTDSDSRRNGDPSVRKETPISVEGNDDRESHDEESEGPNQTRSCFQLASSSRPEGVRRCAHTQTSIPPYGQSIFDGKCLAPYGGQPHRRPCPS